METNQLKIVETNNTPTKTWGLSTLVIKNIDTVDAWTIFAIEPQCKQHFPHLSPPDRKWSAFTRTLFTPTDDLYLVQRIIAACARTHRDAQAPLQKTKRTNKQTDKQPLCGLTWWWHTWPDSCPLSPPRTPPSRPPQWWGWSATWARSRRPRCRSGCS